MIQKTDRPQPRRLYLTDIVDKATRSRMMAGISGRNTKPEMLLRRHLHAAGFRYRLHAKELPGRPDLVFPKFNAVVFVHGCFWHRHPNCRLTTTPSTNADFWLEKLEGNANRDIRNVAQLRATHWRVAVVWECALRKRSPDQIVDELARWLNSTRPAIEISTD